MGGGTLCVGRLFEGDIQDSKDVYDIIPGPSTLIDIEVLQQQEYPADSIEDDRKKP